MGSGSETMTVLEFADVIEDLVKNPGKEFRSDLKEVFVSTTAVRRLKMIDSHFSKDQRKKLSEILKKI